MNHCSDQVQTTGTYTALYSYLHTFCFLKIETLQYTTLERFVSEREITWAIALGSRLSNFFFFIVRVYNETQ